MKRKTQGKKNQEPKIIVMRECPECAGINIVINKDRKQLVCKDCGLITGV
jgi:ribosomal protein S27E